MQPKENFTHSNEGDVTRITAIDVWKLNDLSQYLGTLYEAGLPLESIILDLSRGETMPDLGAHFMSTSDENSGEKEVDQSRVDIVKEINFIGNEFQLEGLWMLLLAIPEISSGARIIGARIKRVA